MAIFDDPAAESDEWWVNRLERAIHNRNVGQVGGRRWSTAVLSNDRRTRPGLELLDAWLRGEPPLPESYADDWAMAWSTFLRMSRMNYAELVISSVTDRLVPVGWSTAADDDPDGDQVAEEVAQETNLVAQGGDAVQDMLSMADGYLLVGQNKGRPLITAESPLSTITAESPSGPRAGLRITMDEWTGEREFWLYRPGYVRTARRDGTQQGFSLGAPQLIPGGEDVFPLVNMRNRRGVGDYERHLDALTRINDSMFTRIVLTKLQAHRQRALEKDPKVYGEDIDGEDNELEFDPEDFTSGPDRIWDLPPGVKLWESQASDLGPLRQIVLDDVKHLCAVTGTPLSDAVPDGANQSAKGSQIVEDKHLFRVQDRMRRADNGIARALSLAFQVLGDEKRAPVHKIQTIWAPVVRYSLTERAQAVSQLNGVWPFERIATDVMQVRPSELPQLQQERLNDFILSGGSGNGSTQPSQQQ